MYRVPLRDSLQLLSTINTLALRYLSRNILENIAVRSNNLAYDFEKYMLVSGISQ